ncbi:MAG: M13 family metallopeptidase [Enterococcus sp.]
MDKALLKEDFYEYVNGDWLKTAKIPADKPATGGFQDLVDEIDKLMMRDVDKLRSGDIPSDDPAMKSFLAYYDLASNYEQRDALGAQPLKPYLDEINAIHSLEELNQVAAAWVLDGNPLPFGLDVDADMKNAQTHALFAEAPRLFLPDKTYYEKEHPNGEQLLKVFFEMMVKLFKLSGYETNQATVIVEEAIAFDKLLAPHVKSAEESADYSKMYNPRSLEEFAKYSTHFDLEQLVTQVIQATPDKVIVTDPVYFSHLDEVLTPTNFAIMKSWMLVKTVRSFSGYLSEEFRQTGGIYSRTLSGTDEAMPQKKAAYYLASGQFSQILGNYYGHTYFGEEAKQDVEHMVEKMIAVYQKRLQSNTWLSDATREKAITKLSKLGIQVGYPDHIPAIYKQLKTVPASEGGTLLSNAVLFSKLFLHDRFSKWNKPVDRTEWEMSADTVNAYYHPFRNIIVFPAAILQAPFYSLEQSSSANFGGIGAVIAHEISHAFDNNGALFDEYGNLNNWWTDEDLEQFQEKAKKMIEEFDGISFAEGKVNGKLTVSENIADAGGLSCALEAAKQEDDASLSEFFINWAKIWRTKAKQEYQQLLLQVDVHAPAKLRANIQPKNLEEFYETFAITSDDPMYLAPEKRVHIW